MQYTNNFACILSLHVIVCVYGVFCMYTNVVHTHVESVAVCQVSSSVTLSLYP